MDNSKTVRLDSTEANIVDAGPKITSANLLYEKQKEDVAAMRTSLLSCDLYSAGSARAAIQNITVMRVYHQISRIVRYTELMDKLENKLYESIETTVDNMSASNPSTWLTLLGIQEKLQKAMIESHKLIQPYLDMESLNLVPIVADTQEEESVVSSMFDQDSRDKIRSSAQAVLTSLSQISGGSNND